METFIKVLSAIILIIILAFLFAFPTMWLWNWLMPVIFGITKITIWQACGINALANILFLKTNTYNKK